MSDVTDPTAQMAAAMSRRAFVAISTGAAAAGTGVAAALGDQMTLGQFHAPLVAEDDSAITVERPRLSRPDGSIDAYAAYPNTGRWAAPGVVVVQHIWGVDAQIRDVVRRFAKAGYVTIAPNLFSRFGAPSGDTETDYTKFARFAQKLVDSQVDGDLAAGATWIRPGEDYNISQNRPKIGVTGFCMGGTITIRQAVDNPIFSAAAAWYGKVRQGADSGGPATELSLAYIDRIQIPLLGSYGARDTSIPVADVQALDARLKVPHDIKIYDEAGHAFFDDQRPRYVASAAADAWNRTLNWFAKYLRGSGPPAPSPSP
jgi:carboxymethylenebutenolidase